MKKDEWYTRDQKRWVRRKILSWIIIGFCFGAFAGIPFGFWWCYRVNVGPAIDRMERLKNIFDHPGIEFKKPPEKKSTSKPPS
jgi:hypothetical protein